MFLAVALTVALAGVQGTPAPVIEQDPPAQVGSGAEAVRAPDRSDGSDRPAAAEDPQQGLQGLRLPDSERLRISLSFLAGYGFDPGNAENGFEKQGRIGYAVVTLAGRLNSLVSYHLSFSPIDEVSPLPGCSVAGFMIPNDPQFLYADLYAAGRGPQIGCDPRGAQRADMYKFIALDTLPQQGMLRQGYVTFGTSTVSVQAGRIAQAVGFTPEEAGSWTAKDAPLIQRFNRDAYFSGRINAGFRLRGLEIGGSFSVILGDSDAGKDYGYNKLFTDGSLDGNSGPGTVMEAHVRSRHIDLRVGYRGNEMGSKIEALSTSYWGAGKHDDNALVYSARYRFNELTMAAAECAHYHVGLRRSSAVMVGFNPAPVLKDGCYATLQGGLPITRTLSIGASVTGERIDRADALIRYLSELGMYGVAEGKDDTMRTVRVFVDLNRQVRLGYYFTAVSNPYPWVSGIYPIAGPGQRSPSVNRWGTVISFTLQ